MVKIIHCGDIHFDTPFSARFTSKQAEIRKAEIRETFSKVIDCAKSADILLISGDLFDNENPDDETVKFVSRKFAEISNIPIFIVAGNHDPYTSGCVYSKNMLGNNVYVFGGELSCVELEKLNLRIYGASFTEKYCEESLLKDIVCDTNYDNILLMHGDVGKKQSRYNPIDLEMLKNCNFKYAALGHIHKFDGINQIGRTKYAYSGAIEGRGFDELDEKGIIEVEIDNGIVNAVFIPVCKRRFKIMDIDVSDIVDNNEIAERILENIQKSDKSDFERDYFRIILSGERVEKFNVNVDVVRGILEDKFYYVEIYDNTTISVDYESFLNENSLRGIFATIMQEKLQTADNDEREILKRALKLGIEAMTD